MGTSDNPMCFAPKNQKVAWYSCINTFIDVDLLIDTIVWEKLVVGNIHEKKFHGKKFSS